MQIVIRWSYGDLTILTVLTAASLFWCTGQDIKDIPAWIQAVGSVLAILAVFWISDSNRKKEQQSRNQSVLAVARVAHDFAKHIHVELLRLQTEKACGFDDSSIRSIYHHDISRGYGEALANVPLHELGSPWAVQALLSLQVQFSVFLPEVMDRLLKGPNQINPFDDTGTQARLFEEFIQRKISTMRPLFEKIESDWNVLEVALA
jgi:predicted MPP superfamily phosphohydrolase